MTHLFEVLTENAKQMDVMAGLMNAFANTLQGITTLHESTQERLKDLTQERHAEVRSVREEF